MRAESLTVPLVQAPQPLAFYLGESVAHLCQYVIMCSGQHQSEDKYDAASFDVL
jgi:hypothetical protein